ncbi:hypothetical protein GIB67_004690 [Kingdonia uniflora]|uniref:FAR1 domain-containing protein n=1 Tax=Kingdonia uniflora TaxID=39325 RepID=A0A7J7P4V3_9MAGN|nr:hypothetical protein GIB67_004690 [Kingdonia uniflora]
MVYEGMVCDSEEDAFKKYNEFARKVGFSVRKDKIYKRADGSIRSRMFVCFKQGLRKEDKRCKNTTKVRSESRTDCKARMSIKNEEDEWTVSEIVYEHNHLLATPSKAYMLHSQRKVKDVHLAEIKSLNATGITPVEGFNYMVHQAGGCQNVGITYVDYKNVLCKRREEELKKGDACIVMEYFIKMQA